LEDTFFQAFVHLRWRWKDCLADGEPADGHLPPEQMNRRRLKDSPFAVTPLIVLEFGSF